MSHGSELTVVVVVCVALAAGAATRAFARTLRFPYTVAMLLLGLASGLGLRHLELHLLAPLFEARTVVSPDLIIFVFLPALVFESAYGLDLHAFRKNAPAAIILAVPALLVATALTAFLMLGLTQLQWHWSLMAALVFGALISATDPVAVVALLRETNAPKRLAVLTEGESLLNDGTAIVLFSVLVAFLTGSGADLTGPTIALRFVGIVAGGIGVGLGLALVASTWLGRTFNDPLVEITLTVVLAYAAMVIAEGILHVSGVLAVVTAGLFMHGPGRTRISPEVGEFLHRFWEMLSYLANTLIFFLVGFVVAVQFDGVSWQTLAVIGATYVGVMVVRFAVVFGFRPVMGLAGEPVSARQAAILGWGGLRGAVSLALGLVVSQHPGIERELGAQILQVTAGVVLLTILLNGTTTTWLLRKLGFDRESPSVVLARLGARAAALTDVQERLADVATAPDLRTVHWAEAKEDLDQRKSRLDDELGRLREDLARANENERAAGLWRQALSIERRAYWSIFARGTLGAIAARRLDREIDLHLDRLQRGELEPPETRTARSRSARDVVLRVAQRLGLPTTGMQIDRLELVYDTARAEAHAADEVRHAMASLEGVDSEVVGIIDRTYARYQTDAKERLEGLRVHMPELTAAVETRLARRIELNFEREAYEHSMERGVMQERDAQQALAEVERRMKRLGLGAKRVALPETAELCETTPLFRGLDADTVHDLAEITSERAYGQDEVLFRQGDKGDAAFVVARGAVHVVASEDGEERLLDVLGGGDIVGEMALLEGAPRNATARTATPVTVGRIARDDFERLMRERPAVRERIWESFAERSFDNLLRGLREHRHLDRDARHEWIRGRPHVVLEAGESLDVRDAPWGFLVTGRLQPPDGEPRRGPALLSFDQQRGWRALEPARIVLLGPPPRSAEDRAEILR